MTDAIPSRAATLTTDECWAIVVREMALYAEHDDNRREALTRVYRILAAA